MGEVESQSKNPNEPKANKALQSITTVLTLFKNKEPGKAGVDKRIIKFLEYSTNESTPVPRLNSSGETLTLLWDIDGLELEVSMSSTDESLEFRQNGTSRRIEGDPARIASTAKKILQKLSRRLEILE